MQNLIDPAILFFIFGVLAGAVKSNLEIPPAISRFLSLYLLMALGLKGGFALSESGLTADVGVGLGAAITLAICIPLLGYWILKPYVGGFDAAAVAATYGSVSAVTFVTAVQYLENMHIAYGGHMAAAMALMESPAIIMAVVFANSLRLQASDKQPLIPQKKSNMSVGKVLHESFTDGAQLLLLGAMVVGLITGESGKAAMQPFSGDLFKGMLSFFLLDMGLMAARNMGQLKGQSGWLLIYAIAGPLVHAAIALLLAIPAAYAMSRYRFAGKGLYRNFLLMTQMMSPIVLVLGLFRLMMALGLVNNLNSLVVTYAAFNLAFTIWMLQSYFNSIPRDLEEAAWIDGASHFTSLVKIFLPLAVPAMVVAAIFTFINSWNEFVLALTLMRSSEDFTLPVQIYAQVAGRYQVEWHHVMAGTVLATVPVAIVFSWLQRYLIRGMALGAVK